jgi:hypothetical protein
MNLKTTDFDELRRHIKDNLTVKEICHKMGHKNTSETKRFIFELSQIDKELYEVKEHAPSNYGYINTKGQLVVASDFIKEFAASCGIEVTKETKVDANLNISDKSITITFNM